MEREHGLVVTTVKAGGATTGFQEWELSKRDVQIQTGSKRNNGQRVDVGFVARRLYPGAHGLHTGDLFHFPPQFAKREAVPPASHRVITPGQPFLTQDKLQANPHSGDYSTATKAALEGTSTVFKELKVMNKATNKVPCLTLLFLLFMFAPSRIGLILIRCLDM